MALHHRVLHAQDGVSGNAIERRLVAPADLRGTTEQLALDPIVSRLAGAELLGIG